MEMEEKKADAWKDIFLLVNISQDGLGAQTWELRTHWHEKELSLSLTKLLD